MKNKNKNKQTGSIYIVAVIILSIAILGTIGFIIWQSFGQTESNDTDSVDSKASTVKANTDKVTTTDAGVTTDDESDVATADDGNVKYFAIDFWNIKGVYSGSHYLGYSIPSSDLLLLDSTELPASCTSGVGRIKRFKADDLTRGYPASAVGDNVADQKASVAYASNSYTASGGNRKVGEYYYVLTTPLQYCADANASALQKTIFADVLKYFKTIKAI